MSYWYLIMGDMVYMTTQQQSCTTCMLTTAYQ